MELIISPTGEVRFIYSEEVDLAELGHVRIRRASRVEPDASGAWWADLLPVRGPDLGPFLRRSHALDAERRWLDQHLATLTGL